MSRVDGRVSSFSHGRRIGSGVANYGMPRWGGEEECMMPLLARKDSPRSRPMVGGIEVSGVPPYLLHR